MIESLGLKKGSFSLMVDEKLLELLQAGEAAAFDEIYQRYSKRLLFYLYRMLGGQEEKAQDFLHDIFVKVIENPQLFDTGQRFSTWIYAVAHNRCKNEYRRMSSRRYLDIDNEMGRNQEIRDVCDDANTLEGRVDRKHFTQALEQELELLSPDEKSTFLLRFKEDFSIKEIADMLDIPEGTVKSRLFNITRKLAAKLKRFQPLSKEVI